MLNNIDGFIRLSFLLFVLLSSAFSIRGQIKGQKVRPSTMVFSTHYECSGNACPYYVLAEGIITAQTPKLFESFMRKVTGKPTVYFNSAGGDLAAGIALGRIIRKLGLDTFVGGPYDSFKGFDARHDEKIETLVNKGICFSACSYAFLGGTTRSLQSTGMLGVHQFYGKKIDSGESATQVVMTLLARYVDEMGVSREFLDLASLTPSAEIQPLSVSVAQKLNVDNTNPPKGEWKVDVVSSGQLVTYVIQKQPGKNGILMFSLTNKNGLIYGKIRHQIFQQFRSTIELKQAFMEADVNRSNEPKPHLFLGEDIDFDKEIPFRSINNWNAESDGSFSLSFTLTINSLNLIARSEAITFEGGFPHAYEDIDPSVTFSTKNLLRILPALLNGK